MNRSGDEGATASSRRGASRGLRALAMSLLVVGLVAGAMPQTAAASLIAVSDSGVSPTAVDTGSTTSLRLYAEATGVNTTDGSTDANVTFYLPAALDLSGATVTARSVSPNATAVDASVDATGNAVTVEWDDDAGTGSDTLNATVTVSGVGVKRSGTHTIAVGLDDEGDGTEDVRDARGTVVTASTPGSDRRLTGTAGEAFVGETDVDVSGLAGVAPAGQSQSFHGQGDVAGTLVTVSDTSDVDVTADVGFVPGGYAATADGETRLAVTRPRVSDVTLYTGTDTSGSDVTNGSFPSSVTKLTVDPTFNFAAAENVTVVVEDADGLNVTETVADSGRPQLGSGETATLDVSNLGVGTYTVRVEGAEDLTGASATATFAVRGAAKTISVDRTRLRRGESAVVTVTGAPGDVRYVRVDADALKDGLDTTLPVAERLFDQTKRVVRIDADAEAGYLYAVVSLDDEGFGRVRLRTDALAVGTHRLELSTTADATSTEDDVPLTVFERNVAVSAPATAAVGGTVRVTGSAVGSETVKLFARVDDQYRPLYADAGAGTLAEADVHGDGSWETNVDTRRVLSLPDTYRVVAVADPGSHEGSTAALSAETVHGFEATGAASIRTVPGSLSGTVTPVEVGQSTGDEATISGRAVGQGDEVRLYVVGPRGSVTARDVDVHNRTFSAEYGAFTVRGEYRLLLVGPGRDGAFAYADDGDAGAVRAELSGSDSQSQATATLRDAYSGPGVDDELVALDLRVASPSLSVEAVTGDDRVSDAEADSVTVAGDANREPGTVVTVRVEADGDAVAFTQASVDQRGRWRTTLDLANVAHGTYTLRAEDGVSTASRRFQRVATGENETTATPREPPSETASPTVASTTTAGTAASVPGTETGTETTTTGPGFGLVTALAALLVLGAAARRRD